MIERITLPGANRHLGLKGIHKRGCSEAHPPAFGTNAGVPSVECGVDKEPALRRFTAGERQRAQRFPIQTGLRYRRVGEGEWRQGTMVNISESGVLFETDHAAWPNTAVEMRFSLCTGISIDLPARVMCCGLIARAVSEPGSARVTALAARITKFEFVRPGQAPVA
jgi:hypothetical protein